MKMKLEELKRLVGEAVAEAKKKEKPAKKGKEVQPKGFVAAEENDFSPPLGVHSRYRREGAANFGPYTSEGVLRQYVRSVVETAMGTGPEGPMHREDGMDDESPEAPMHRDPSTKSEDDQELKRKLEGSSQLQREAVVLNPHLNIWENVAEAAHWYQKEGWNLAEKRIGFKALKGKLAHKKGVHNPGALAAYIGRKKLGSKEMARRSAVGRKKK